LKVASIVTVASVDARPGASASIVAKSAVSEVIYRLSACSLRSLGLALQIQENYHKRAALLAAMNKARSGRYKKRVAKASSWENLFHGKIKVRITHCSDRTEYLETLKGLARGAKLRELDLKLLTDRYHPSALIEHVLSGNAENLAEPPRVRRLVGFWSISCTRPVAGRFTHGAGSGATALVRKGPDFEYSLSAASHLLLVLVSKLVPIK